MLYLSTLSSPNAQAHLERALSSLLAALSQNTQEHPKVLYQLYYEQTGVDVPFVNIDGQRAEFSPLPLDLAFNDSVMDPVRSAWEMVNSNATEEERAEYLVFTDREGADAEDEFDD